MLRVILGACVALAHAVQPSAHTSVGELGGTVSVLTTDRASHNSTASSRETSTVVLSPDGSGRRAVEDPVDSLRRQLMNDNYDYVYVGSGDAGTATSQQAQQTRASTQLKNVTNVSPSISPTNEDKPRYKAFEEVDDIKTINNDWWEEQEKPLDNRIKSMDNDLLYYLDDKHLRRSNKRGDDARQHYDDSLSEIYSDEYEVYTTKKSRRQRITTLDRRYRQLSKMYDFNHRHQSGGVSKSYKKRNRKDRKHKKKLSYGHQYRALKYARRNKPYASIENSDKEGDNPNSYDTVNVISRKVAKQRGVIQDKNNDSQAEPYENERNDEQNEINNDNSKDFQTISHVESIYRTDQIYNHQPNGSHHSLPELKDNGQVDSNSNHTDSGDGNKSEEQTIGHHIDNIKEQPSTQGAEHSATGGVKYKLLRMRHGGGSRRSGSGQRVVVEARDAGGLVLTALGAAPVPQFRLPRARRQYMHQRPDPRPPLHEQLARRHQRTNTEPSLYH